jgi:transglutaminase-like putative cysteine protease
MSTVNAFSPKGQTFLVTTSDVQIKTQDNVSAISYRVRNLTTATAYFGWKPADPTGATVAIGTVTTPTAGSPSQNVIGMFPQSVEVFTLPPNVWMKSDTANAFEVIAGEGI